LKGCLSEENLTKNPHIALNPSLMSKALELRDIDRRLSTALWIDAAMNGKGCATAT